MAGVTIKELRAELTGDLSKLNKVLGQAEGKAQKFGKAMKGLAKGIAIVFAAATAAAVGATAALVKIADSASKAGDKLAKMGKRTGLAVKDLEALRFVASQSDTSLQSFEKAVIKMNSAIVEGADELEKNNLMQKQYRLTLKTLQKQYKNLNKSADNYADKEEELRERIEITTEQLRIAEEQTGTYSEALKALGTSSEELEQMTPVERIKFFAEALKDATENSEKMDAGRKVLGRGMADLLPAFSDGEEGIQKLIDRSKELTGVWTEESAKAAEAYQDHIDEIKTTLRGLKDFLGIELMKVFDPLVQRATDFVVEHKEEIRGYLTDLAGTVDDVAKIIVEKFKGIDWEEVLAKWDVVKRWFGDLVDGIEAFVVPALDGIYGQMKKISSWFEQKETERLTEKMAPRPRDVELARYWLEKLEMRRQAMEEAGPGILGGISFYASRWSAQRAEKNIEQVIQLLAQKIAEEWPKVAEKGEDAIGKLLDIWLSDIKEEDEELAKTMKKTLQKGIVDAIGEMIPKVREKMKELADELKLTESHSPPLIDLGEMVNMGREIVGALMEGVSLGRRALSAEVGSLAGQLRAIIPAQEAKGAGDSYTMSASFDVKNEGIPIDPVAFADEFLEEMKRRTR